MFHIVEVKFYVIYTAVTGDNLCCQQSKASVLKGAKELVSRLMTDGELMWVHSYLHTEELKEDFWSKDDEI